MSFADVEKYEWLLESYTSGNRVAIMSPSGDVLVLNKSAWVEDGGILYSNKSYKAYTYTAPAYSGSNGYESWWLSGNLAKANNSTVAKPVVVHSNGKQVAKSYALTNNRYDLAATGVHKGGQPFSFRMDPQYNAQIGYISKRSGTRVWVDLPEKLDQILIKTASKLFYDETIAMKDIRAQLMKLMLEVLRGVSYAEVEAAYLADKPKQTVKAATAPAEKTAAAS